MRRSSVAAGLLALGVIVILARDFKAVSDPWAIQVTIEKGYHRNGNIASETQLNRRREIHGWQILYNEEGRIASEALYDHGVWVISRTFEYEKGQVSIGEANFTNPQFSVEPIPEGYYEYRRIERLLETSGAE